MSHTTATRCPPPPNFRPAGEVLRANFSLTPPSFIKPYRVQGRRADGLRYERKGQEWLASAREHTYVPGPWFRFANRQCLLARSQSQSRKGYAWCQPDGLDIDIRRGLITIVEFKLQHTSAAWWQTRKLYEPVVRRVFGDNGLWDFAVVEIVKWYDHDVAFPERFSFIPSLADVQSGEFHVIVWNGRQKPS